MNQPRAAKPIPIKTSNLAIKQQQQPAVCPYPSPVSPSTMAFSPTSFLSTYSLPRRLTSQYMVRHELGFGGFGFVYAVTRIADGAQLACKFIFKSKVSPSSWTSDRDLGTCPMEVAVLKNVANFGCLSI